MYKCIKRKWTAIRGLAEILEFYKQTKNWGSTTSLTFKLRSSWRVTTQRSWVEYLTDIKKWNTAYNRYSMKVNTRKKICFRKFEHVWKIATLPKIIKNLVGCLLHSCNSYSFSSLSMSRKGPKVGQRMLDFVEKYCLGVKSQ